MTMTPFLFKIVYLIIIGVLYKEFCVASNNFPMEVLDYDISNTESLTPSQTETPLEENILHVNSVGDMEQMNKDGDQILRGEVVLRNTKLDGTHVRLEDISINAFVYFTNNTHLSKDKSNVTSIVVCSTGKENGSLPVELVNSTRLVNILITESNITDRRTSADCSLVLFYARYCPFSSMTAPHFNALPRAFPDIKFAAVDAMKYHSFNTQYGIVGVPTLMLFHNGRPAAKFNESEYNLETFAKFITKYTGLQPYDKLFVTSADFGGPVPSVPTKETDYCLILSWAFMMVCGLYFFSKSSWWRWISEAVQNTWREAEAQHEHGD